MKEKLWTKCLEKSLLANFAALIRTFYNLMKKKVIRLTRQWCNPKSNHLFFLGFNPTKIPLMQYQCHCKIVYKLWKKKTLSGANVQYWPKSAPKISPLPIKFLFCFASKSPGSDTTQKVTTYFFLEFNPT